MADKQPIVFGNLVINQEENFVSVNVNPKFYPLDVVYSASYIFLDKAYIVLNGDPEEKIIVELRPKEEKIDLEVLGRDFNNELLTYAVYSSQSKKAKRIKEAIVGRAMETNTYEDEEGLTDEEFYEDEEARDDGIDDDENAEDEEDLSYIDDPLGIAVPWEEKYGKEDKQD